MIDDLPNSRIAIYILLEMIALGFALEAVAAFARGDSVLKWAGLLVMGIVFMILGVKSSLLLKGIQGYLNSRVIWMSLFLACCLFLLYFVQRLFDLPMSEYRRFHDVTGYLVVSVIGISVSCGLWWLAGVAAKTPVGSMQLDTKKPATEQPESTTPVTPTQHLFINRKPKDLLDFYKHVSPLQADDLMKPYVGRWMIVEGKAATNPVDAGNGSSQFIVVDDEGAHCTCTFASQWRQDVKTVRTGDNVKMQGRISEGQNGATLYLGECDLLQTEHNPKGALAAKVVDENNAPLEGAEIYFIRRNGVHASKAVSDTKGVAEVMALEEVVSVYCALDGFSSYYKKDYDSSTPLTINLNKSLHGGSVIFADGTGYIPGLTGRLNPILDTEARTYLYAENIAIDGGKTQPVPFVLNRPLTLEDVDGHKVEITIISIIHSSSLIDYRKLM
jgi:hypothetical protein